MIEISGVSGPLAALLPKHRPVALTHSLLRRRPGGRQGGAIRSPIRRLSLGSFDFVRRLILPLFNILFSIVRPHSQSEIVSRRRPSGTLHSVQLFCGLEVFRFGSEPGACYLRLVRKCKGRRGESSANRMEAYMAGGAQIAMLG